MKIKRKGSAAWQGGIKDGKGTISTESGALTYVPPGLSGQTLSLTSATLRGGFSGLAPRRSAAHAAGAKAASNTACNDRGRFRNTSV